MRLPEFATIELLLSDFVENMTLYGSVVIGIHQVDSMDQVDNQ